MNNSESNPLQGYQNQSFMNFRKPINVVAGFCCFLYLPSMLWLSTISNTDIWVTMPIWNQLRVE